MHHARPVLLQKWKEMVGRGRCEEMVEAYAVVSCPATRNVLISTPSKFPDSSALVSKEQKKRPLTRQNFLVTQPLIIRNLGIRIRFYERTQQVPPLQVVLLRRAETLLAHFLQRPVHDRLAVFEHCRSNAFERAEAFLVACFALARLWGEEEG